jgi:hypothetical protein
LETVEIRTAVRKKEGMPRLVLPRTLLVAAALTLSMAAGGCDDDPQIPDAGPVDAGTDAGPEPVEIVSVEAATEEECPTGGTAVRRGIDENFDGVLQPGEVASSSLICQPADSLVTTADEPEGENCEFGGTRIDAGRDDDDDGELDAEEVDSTTFICNGAPGSNGMNGADAVQVLISITAEEPGENCDVGGNRVDSGLDDDDDGVLDPEEIDSTVFVCSGADGTDGTDGVVALVTVTELTLGDADCPAGGQRIQTGLDDDRSGTLEEVEVDSTSDICNPIPSLVDVTPEPPGDNCVNGGNRIDTGVDDNVDGVLDPSEIDATIFACDGSDGSDGMGGSLVSIVPEPIGPNCASGGQRIDVGVDDDTNGVLDPAEVDSTSYVCNASATVPFSILTGDADVPDGALGQPYSATIEAIGGTGGNYSWSISAGSLPAGLSIEATGTPSTTISGSPTATGSSTFTVTVTDFFGAVATRSYTIDVAEDLAFDDYTLDPVESGTVYSQTLTASGGATPYTYTLDADTDLPAGLTLAADGTISGTPTSGQGADVLVTVTDGAMDAVTALIRIPSQTRWAAVQGDFITDNDDAVAVINVEGATPAAAVTVSTPLTTGTSLVGTGTTSNGVRRDVQFSASGVAFLGDFTTDGVTELYYVDLSGASPGATQTVNGALVLDGDVQDFLMSPDGSRIAYVADETTDAINELYVVDITGGTVGAPQRVNAALSGSSDVTNDDYYWSPDSRFLVYLADPVASGLEELFLVDMDDVTPTGTQISPALGGTTSSWDVDDQVEWTPDSRYVVFRAETRSSSSDADLFIVDATAATPTSTQINQTLLSARSVNLDDWHISPNGERVAYIADADTDNDFDVYVVDIPAGVPGTARRLTTVVSGGDASEIIWSPDSRQLAVIGDVETDNQTDVFVVDTDPSGSGSPTRLNRSVASADALLGSSTTRYAQWSPDGGALYYYSDLDIDGVTELYRTDLADAGTSIRVNAALSGSSDVDSNGRLDLLGGYFAFTADPAASSVTELFLSTDPAAASPPAPLTVQTPALMSGSLLDVFTSSFNFSSDGDGIVYRGDLNTDGVNEAFYVSITGATLGAQTALVAAPPSGGDVDLVHIQGVPPH